MLHLKDSDCHWTKIKTKQHLHEISQKLKAPRGTQRMKGLTERTLAQSRRGRTGQVGAQTKHGCGEAKHTATEGKPSVSNPDRVHAALGHTQVLLGPCSADPKRDTLGTDECSRKARTQVI